MTEHVIEREVAGNRGRYVIRRPEGEAEVTYSIASPVLILADHTGVPDAFRGTGAGVALVSRLVADARAEGVRVVAVCPFVKAQAERHPEWADVFTSG